MQLPGNKAHPFYGYTHTAMYPVEKQQAGVTVIYPVISTKSCPIGHYRLLKNRAKF